MGVEISGQAIAQLEAQMIDKRFREMWAGARATLDEMGKMFHDIAEQSLWRQFVYPKDIFEFELGEQKLVHAKGSPFQTIDSWLENAIPESGRSTIYAARARYKALCTIPDDERRKIPVCNAEVLREVPESERNDKENVKLAQNLTEAKFVKKMQEKYPDQHIERKKPMKLRPASSQHDAIDDAINAFKWLNDTKMSREEALEGICQEFLDSKCEVEGFRNLTNRMAYLKATGKAKGAGA
jgi:hypothetical protein